MSRLVVYSANIGGYDWGPALHPATDQADERILFSDAPIDRPGWRNVVVPSHFADAKRNVQYLKTRPDLLFGEDARTVWVDASLRQVRLDADIMQRLVAPPGVVASAPPHLRRTTLRKEALVVERHRLDTPEAVRRGLALLDAMGFPDRSGLSAASFVYRDLRDPRVRAADQAWFRMILAGSRRDQLSFNAAYWSAGLRVHDIAIDWRRPNELFSRAAHRSPVHRELSVTMAGPGEHPALATLPEAFTEEGWTHGDLAVLRDIARLPVATAGSANLAWGASVPDAPEFALPSPALAPARRALRAAALGARLILDASTGQGIHAALCLRANPAARVLADLAPAAMERLRRAFGDRILPVSAVAERADLILLDARGDGAEAAAAGAAAVIALGPPEAGMRDLLAAAWVCEPPGPGSDWLRWVRPAARGRQGQAATHHGPRR
jgi:hypothetical protein